MDNTESNVALELTKIQIRLMAFICKLNGGVADSEDILQAVNVKLWQQRHAYDAARPFFTWACAVAKYEVLRHRKDNMRLRRFFSDAFIGEMARRLAGPDAKTSLRLAYLEQCEAELSGSLRQMVDWFYMDRLSIADIAKKLGRTAGSIANSLYYARHLLRLCVEGKIAAEGRA